MELIRIEALLEKYFEGETNSAEENELKNYFSSPDVAPHLEQYQSMFGYFSLAKQQRFEQKITKLPNQGNKKRNLAWFSIAASVLVFFGVGTFVYFNQEPNQSGPDLGTYDNPEEAFRETQKALALLSQNVNAGIESVQYIQEYESTVDRAFKDY